MPLLVWIAIILLIVYLIGNSDNASKGISNFFEGIGFILYVLMFFGAIGSTALYVITWLFSLIFFEPTAFMEECSSIAIICWIGCFVCFAWSHE